MTIAYTLDPTGSRMGRAALNWTVKDLAAEAGVSTNTVVRLERGERLGANALERIRAALESGGVRFMAWTDAILVVTLWQHPGDDQAAIPSPAAG